MKNFQYESRKALLKQFLEGLKDFLENYLKQSSDKNLKKNSKKSLKKKLRRDFKKIILEEFLKSIQENNLKESMVYFQNWMIFWRNPQQKFQYHRHFRNIWARKKKSKTQKKTQKKFIYTRNFQHHRGDFSYTQLYYSQGLL